MKRIHPDAIETAKTLGLLDSTQQPVRILHHYLRFPFVRRAATMQNFNAKLRLSSHPFPTRDRPRGNRDLESVAYFRQRIQQGKSIDPIVLWSDFTLLDGVHRMVAMFQEGKSTIPAIIVGQP